VRTGVLPPEVASAPTLPGVYLFKDGAGRIIYIGKAKSLRDRLGSYFQDPARLPPKTLAMLRIAASLEQRIVRTELEALFLECSLIKEHRPRYNIVFKDDKGLPYVRVSSEEFPRLEIVRRIAKDGARYFGPFLPVQALRETVRLVSTLFPLRRCARDLSRRWKRPCLNHQMGICPGPCVEAIGKEEYAARVERVVRILSGRDRGLLRDLKAEMEGAAEDLAFERAAKLRDQMTSLMRYYARQQVISVRPVDVDAIAASPDAAGGHAATIVYVRGGKVVGQETVQVAPIDGEFWEAFLRDYALSGRILPPVVLINGEFPTLAPMTAWLSEQRGGRVSLRRPVKGLGRSLVSLAELNLVRHLAASPPSGDRVTALTELQALIGLSAPPVRIEAYDVSNLSGREAVASRVAFVDGEASPGGYRRYRLRRRGEADDYASLAEALERRARRAVAGEDPLPDLIIIDGGRGHLAAAKDALSAAGAEQVPLAGVAKGPDRKSDALYLPGRTNPKSIREGKPAYLLLRRIRDEAHRFAITYHRHLRGKRQLRTSLRSVEGVGPLLERRLLREFGDIAGIAAAGESRIAAVAGVSRPLAARIAAFLNEGSVLRHDTSSHRMKR
jgi:excinuclease ABC subunit C